MVFLLNNLHKEMVFLLKREISPFSKIKMSGRLNDSQVNQEMKKMVILINKKRLISLSKKQLKKLVKLRLK